MLRPLGFYFSLGISHNFPRKMRPKVVVPQEVRGDDPPSSWQIFGIGRKYGLLREWLFDFDKPNLHSNRIIQILVLELHLYLKKNSAISNFNLADWIQSLRLNQSIQKIKNMVSMPKYRTIRNFFVQVMRLKFFYERLNSSFLNFLYLRYWKEFLANEKVNGHQG